MEFIIEKWQTVLVWASFSVLVAIGAVLLGWAAWRAVKAVRRALTMRELAMFAFAAVVCTYAAQKTGTITFLRTDPNCPYLIDEGSSLTAENGGGIYVDFSVDPRVPGDAHIYVANKCIDPPEDDWTTQWQVVLQDLIYVEGMYHFDAGYENATNYNWVVYTDWTPGTTVVTNGVWHARWGNDNKGNGFIIPVNTKVTVDGDVIAPPNIRDGMREQDVEVFTLEEETEETNEENE